MVSNCKGLVYRFKILGSVHEWESYLAQNASLLSITDPPILILSSVKPQRMELLNFGQQPPEL